MMRVLLKSLRTLAPALFLCVAGSAALAAGATGADRHPDFTGLWKIAGLETVKRSGEWDAENLTPKAKAARAYFQAHKQGFDDESVGHCVAHGLPWAMTSPARDYMHDIYQTKDRITILFEGMEVYRVIHLDQKEVPEGFTSGTWGYSIGHWEGDTLVIVTRNLNEKNPFGMNQRSADAVVTERWKMVRDPKYGPALDIDIAIDDPVNYIQPSHGHELLVRGPPGTVLLPYGCTETLWEAYVEKRRAEIGTGTKE